MQWILERLKGRVGVAVVLVLVVLAAVGIGRALGGRDPDPGLPAFGSGSRSGPSINPSEQDDGVEGVEGGPTDEPPGPSLSPGAAPPLQVARSFLDAWLSSRLSAAQWHAGISRYATPALAEKLSGVDPVDVPAQRVTGEPTLIPRGAGASAVRTPVDSGTVELRLLVTGGRWLVDGVDWGRG